MHPTQFRRRHALCTLLLGIQAVRAQPPLPNTFPHDYPGKPTGDFSPDWQSYFEVTQALPNVTFPIGRNWAGNIAVDRPGHPNDTLFFWAWEKQNGSLTADAGESTEPWGIWLNGGPGSSSLVGLFFENGPLHIREDYSMFSNNFSWHLLADYIWVDQPVGTGFSTADSTGYVADEDQMGQDFMNFLANLVKVFPSLKTRPLYLTGESYAGTYIPYITKAYFGSEDPPVNLARIDIGDGTIGNGVEFNLVPTVSFIGTYPQLIGYDQQVYKYFQEQSHLCGFDLNLTYPQDGLFPTLKPPQHVRGGGVSTARQRAHKSSLLKQALRLDLEENTGVARRSMPYDEVRLLRRDQWKRELAGRANGSIDPWYECDIWDEMIDYAFNFSLPWSNRSLGAQFDFYNIPDALGPEAPMDASVFLNDNRTRAAIHAPTSLDWQESLVFYPFGSNSDGLDPSPEPMVFLTELATNATERGVHVIIYSGNDDSLVPHLSSEIVIQNTTFGGIQGFTRPPSTPWFGDDGVRAGIVHQERNWTYVLVENAGHLVAQQQPGRAFVFAREFIFGNNQTGLVTNTSGTISVAGGEDPALAGTVLPGQLGIYVGSGTTQSTYTISNLPGLLAASDGVWSVWSSSVQNVSTQRSHWRQSCTSFEDVPAGYMSIVSKQSPEVRVQGSESRAQGSVLCCPAGQRLGSVFQCTGAVMLVCICIRNPVDCEKPRLIADI